MKGQVCTLRHKNCAYCYARLSLCVFVCDHSSVSSSSLTSDPQSISHCMISGNSRSDRGEQNKQCDL